MLDKLTDTVKFFIFLTVYTVAIAYWAGELTANLKAQTINLQQQSTLNSKTVELLNAHIADCAERNITHVRLEGLVNHLRDDVNFLLIEYRRKDTFNGIKER